MALMMLSTVAGADLGKMRIGDQQSANLTGVVSVIWGRVSPSEEWCPGQDLNLKPID
jgi:hypothetical protein